MPCPVRRCPGCRPCRVLVGRDRGRDRLARALADGRAGHGGALVIRGEAGMGKTGLLDRLARDAREPDVRIVRGTGFETEGELPFGGLHLLVHPFTDRFDALPAQQAAALRSAFGAGRDPVHDRFLIGAAILTLLSEPAAERPLLCLVGDVQWPDRAWADAPVFAACRIGAADPLLMVFAVRDRPGRSPSPGSRR